MKVDTDHNKVSYLVYDLKNAATQPVFTTEFLLTMLQNGVYHFTHEDHLPPLPGNDIYLQNNVFRI
ncbi:hypothetical protein MKP09_20215 [Niabella ginsengisoli]|uniref:Uncharacterized protein n=1 Tax=Niabella ginsengisoli TaxID=522298 RepID=A0ABS9SNX5_9BACT|nr:hypothetical protein [Niabella ginsengisoli]MCH5600076.1 hypothetical protein [Niabella ginsengisoli]